MFDIFELFERWLRTHDVRNNPNWRLLSLIISLLFDSFLYLIIILYFLCYGVVVMLCSQKFVNIILGLRIKPLRTPIKCCKSTSAKQF